MIHSGMEVPAIMGVILVILLVLTALMIVITAGVKSLRAAKNAWYGSHYRRIEPALEDFVATGERQPGLESLRHWQRDLFLSTLMVERMTLLRGTGREHMMWLARDLGLVDRYLRDLRSRRRWRRARAAQNLGHFGGGEVVPELGKLFDDEDETVRAVAVRALARIGGPEAVGILVRTLDNPSELTRLRVAENLDRAGYLAVPPLIELLESAVEPGEKHPYGPVLASQVLGGLRAPEARPALRLAAEAGPNGDIRAQAALALGKIGDPDDVPLLLETALDAEWPARTQAANSLGMIGETTSMPRLKELVSDEAWWVRVAASKALANMGTAGEDALVELLQSSNRYAADRAAATLEMHGVTRRLVRQLSREDRRGERARRTVGEVVRAGYTRYLRDLAQSLPEGVERGELEGLLQKTPIESGDER